MTAEFPTIRLRRLRNSVSLRDLFREVSLRKDQLIYPVFVEERLSEPTEIPSMPGIYRIPEDHLAAEVQRIAAVGVRTIILFGISHHKDATGSDTCKDDGLMARMVKCAKAAASSMVVITDNCLCEYTVHGHCGIIMDDKVDNDATIEKLSRQAVVCAEAGADFVAPSAMMDGQVIAIRRALDAAGHSDTPIMAYSSKFSSSLYGPFRDAAGCSLKGDRRAYQMDPCNAREAIREAELDIQEGADVIMVKPALTNLDILSSLRSRTLLPLCGYQVGGEYAMIKLAALAGAVDEEQLVMESLYSIRRAGADLIISYYTYQAIRNGWVN